MWLLSEIAQDRESQIDIQKSVPVWFQTHGLEHCLNIFMPLDKWVEFSFGSDADFKIIHDLLKYQC